MPLGVPPYPVLDTDPHATRVVRYFRLSDYLTWASVTVGMPAALAFWYRSDGDVMSRAQWRTSMKGAGFFGFLGGFMLAYQNSSMRFWGWRENKREEDLDLEELTARAQAGLPLYGESRLPPWIQLAAHRNSHYSQLKFAALPMFNFVNHPYHGTDPAKYGVRTEESSEE